jgi:hypothetical protein
MDPSVVPGERRKTSPTNGTSRRMVVPLGSSTSCSALICCRCWLAPLTEPCYGSNRTQRRVSLVQPTVVFQGGNIKGMLISCQDFYSCNNATTHTCPDPWSPLFFLLRNWRGKCSYRALLKVINVFTETM